MAGKFFAFAAADDVIVKLPADRVAELLDSGAGVRGGAAEALNLATSPAFGVPDAYPGGRRFGGRKCMKVLLGLLLISLSVYCLVECLQSRPGTVRLLPRPLWLLLILLLPLLGPALWWFLGRPSSGAPPTPRAFRKPVAPDDDPDFLRSLRPPPPPPPPRHEREGDQDGQADGDAPS